MRLRTYDIGDTQQIVKLFYDTVHEVNIRDYTQAQDMLAPADMDIERWTKSLSSKFTFVAEEGEKMAGFGELEPSWRYRSLLLSSRFSKARSRQANFKTN